MFHHGQEIGEKKLQLPQLVIESTQHGCTAAKTIEIVSQSVFKKVFTPKIDKKE